MSAVGNESMALAVELEDFPVVLVPEVHRGVVVRPIAKDVVREQRSNRVSVSLSMTSSAK